LDVQDGCIILDLKNINLNSIFLHEICFDKQIQTIIKPRKNVKRGFYRRKQMKDYGKAEYNQRNGIEAGFGALKRKYGKSVSGKKWKSMRTEIYCKAIAHNLNLV